MVGIAVSFVILSKLYFDSRNVAFGWAYLALAIAASVAALFGYTAP